MALGAAWATAAYVPVIADVQAELKTFEEARFAILPSFAWNLIAWLLSMFCVWLAFWLLGFAVSPLRVLALEAFVSVVRSSAFIIPGAVGAQELGYVVLASLMGVDAHAALSLSFLKRARDFVIGIPTLVFWQFVLLRGPVKSTPPPIRGR